LAGNSSKELGALSIQGPGTRKRKLRAPTSVLVFSCAWVRSREGARRALPAWGNGPHCDRRPPLLRVLETRSPPDAKGHPNKTRSLPIGHQGPIDLGGRAFQQSLSAGWFPGGRASVQGIQTHLTSRPTFCQESKVNQAAQEGPDAIRGRSDCDGRGPRKLSRNRPAIPGRARVYSMMGVGGTQPCPPLFCFFFFFFSAGPLVRFWAAANFIQDSDREGFFAPFPRAVDRGLERQQRALQGRSSPRDKPSNKRSQRQEILYWPHSHDPSAFFFAVTKAESSAGPRKRNRGG